MQNIYNLTVEQLEEEINYRNNIIREYKNNDDGIINTARSELEYLEYLKNSFIL